MSEQPVYLSDTWRQIFPETEVADALRFMQETWDFVVQNFPEAVNAEECKEPEITQNLGQHLWTKGEVSALAGVFDYEVPAAGIDPVSGKRVHRIRKDITYTNGAQRTPSGRRLRLIFEFKKLENNSKSRNQYVGTAGMMRFISGQYSIHAEHIAFMVGLVRLPPTVALAGLKTHLNATRVHRALHVLPAADGSYLRQPQTWCAGAVEFETWHSRTAYGGLGDLTLCHMFLEH
jgi:hypothetical protein